MSLRSAVPVARRPVPDPQPYRRADWACVLEGALAAALGLAAVSTVVLLLWTVSPHPDSGPGGALRVAGDLWLLGHGAPLERTSTRNGVPAPVAVTPLLLTVLFGWLVNRAVRVSTGPESRAADGVRAALRVALCYLTVAAGVLLFSAEGPVRAVPWSVALALPLFVLAIGLLTAWCLSGLPAWGERAAWLVETGAPRAAAAGVAALCGAGAALAAGALVRDAGQAGAALGGIAEDGSGRLALLLLVGALAPNAAVWAVAYGLGPGFALGSDVVRSPLATAADPESAPPAFPLLAAVPDATAGPVSPQALLLPALVPLTGALVVAVFLARTAVPARGDRDTATGWRATVVAAGLAAVLVGAALAVLALLAGGPLGTGELARFGPSPWLTGLAAGGWVAVLATPAALGLRAWRLRRSRAERRAARVLRRRAGAGPEPDVVASSGSAARPGVPSPWGRTPSDRVPSGGARGSRTKEGRTKTGRAKDSSRSTDSRSTDSRTRGSRPRTDRARWWRLGRPGRAERPPGRRTRRAVARRTAGASGRVRAWLGRRRDRRASPGAAGTGSDGPPTAMGVAPGADTGTGAATDHGTGWRADDPTA